MAAARDEAVCLRSWDWSETSQTLALFTREHGLVRAIAKGSKREKSAFSGVIEPLTRGEVLFLSKAPGQLATLTSWDLRERFAGPRRSLGGFHAAMYLADVTLHLMSEGDPHPQVFDALVDSLKEVADTKRILAATAAFQWVLLLDAGYRPELDRDVATGETIAGSTTYRFDPRLGGLTADRVNFESPGWRVRAETVNLLRSLISTDRTHIVGTLAASAACERANRFLAAYVREVIGEEIPTYRTVFPADAAPEVRGTSINPPKGGES